MYSLGSYSPAPPERDERDTRSSRGGDSEAYYYVPIAPSFAPPASTSQHYGFRRNGSSRQSSESTRNGRKQGSGDTRRHVREGNVEPVGESPQMVNYAGPSSADRVQGRGPTHTIQKETVDSQRSSSAPQSPSRLSAWTSAGVHGANGKHEVPTNMLSHATSDATMSSSGAADAARSGLILSREQTERYNAFVNGSPFSQRQAQVKALELIQYWLSSPETGEQIDDAIRDVMLESEKSKAAMGHVVQAWGSDSPDAKSEKNRGNKAHGAEKTRSQQKSRPSLEPQLIELEGNSPVAPNGSSKSEKPRQRSDSDGSSPGSRPTTSLSSMRGDGEGSAAPKAKTTQSTSATSSNGTPQAPTTTDKQSGGCTSPQLPAGQASSGDVNESTPQSASFRRRYDKSDDGVAEAHPSEESKKQASREKRRKEHKHSDHRADESASQRSRGESKEVPQPTDTQPSASPTPSMVPHTPSPEPPSAVAPKTVRPPAVSLEEIPRFYFPLGKPLLLQEILNGPTSTKIENPHLKMAEGMALPTTILDGGPSGGAQATALAEAQHPSSSKLCPLSTLRCVEDCHVGQYIQREFSRLPPAPKFDVKSRVRSAGRFRSSNGTPLAKQEAAYRQSLIQCMQRICVQCFGLPRYFSYIIVRLIQREIVEGLSLNSSFRGTKSPSTPATGSVDGGNPKAESAATTLITAQHLKDFYNTHLRGKESRRRIFDVLVLSASLPRTEDGVGPRVTTLDAGRQRTFLLPTDFVPYLEVLLQHHPGLAFLRETPDFQSKYVETVVYRIFYEIDRFDRGRISFSEFANSRLIDAFRQVDATEDINTVLLFFSYEHFYVLYCRFWELNETRNMQLSKEDLARYAPEDTMNPVIVDRIFAGVARPVRCPVKDRIGYEDFVWFCLSEEDKSTPSAIRYWFRILDLDGDGVLSLYELQSFYDATRNKIAEYVVDNVIGFHDVVCQVFDMLRLPRYRPLTLKDFLREPEGAHVALSMLTNVVKFLQFEQRDPFVAHQDRLLGGLEQSRWDRFARIEYDRMAQEADE